MYVVNTQHIYPVLESYSVYLYITYCAGYNKHIPMM